MDIKKDNILSNINKKSYQNDSLLNSSNISIENNIIFNRQITKKTKNILTALLMVTDYIDQKESIRDNIRNKALALFDKVLGLRYLRPQSALFQLQQIDFSIEDIIHFIEISGLLGLISEMNITILIHEFNGLKGDCQEWRHKQAQSPDTLSSIFGNVAEHIFIPPSLISKTNNQTIREELPRESIYNNQKDPNNTSQGHTADRKTSSSTNSRKFDLVFKTERRNTILNLIKDKKEITITDVSEIIKNCSEKTIQRELLSMVSEKIIKKIGNKRWSRYSLA